MLYSIAAVIVMFWLSGIVTGLVLGAFVNLLLVAAIALVLLQLLRGRQASV